MSNELPWLCERIRWKSHSIDEQSVEHVARALAAGGQVTTCLMTADTQGPDADAVSHEHCHSRRGCYRPHRLVEISRRHVS